MIRASPPALWGLGRSAMLNQWLPESIGIDQDPEEHWAPPARKPGLGGRALLAGRLPPPRLCPPADLSPLSAMLSINSPEGPVQSRQAAWARAGGGGSLCLPSFKEEVSRPCLESQEQWCQSPCRTGRVEPGGGQPHSSCWQMGGREKRKLDGGWGELWPSCGGWARRISLEEGSRRWGKGPSGSSQTQSTPATPKAKEGVQRVWGA